MASNAIETTTASMEQPVTQKFSRYKSVRRQNSNNGPALAPPPLLQEASPPRTENPAKSMSRYHRKSPPKPGPIAPMSQAQHSLDVNPSHAASLAALTGEPRTTLQSPPRAHVAMASVSQKHPSQGQNSRGYTSQTTGSSSKRTNQMTIPYSDAKQEARDILNFEQERLQRLRAQQEALRRLRREDAKEKELELAKMRQQVQPVPVQEGVPRVRRDDQQDMDSRPKRSFVIGRSVDQTPTAPVHTTRAVASAESAETDLEPQSNGMLRSTFKSLRHKASASNASSQKRKLVIGTHTAVEEKTAQQAQALLQSDPRYPVPLQAPVEPSKPQAFDAPISAVNAGERRVLVKCNEASITLPITPTTRAQDLLNSASIVMSEDIDPRTAVLVESFTQLRLERPIRRYEHIRDVLNSWDNDDQNVFVITPHSERPESLLETSGVPTKKPKDASFTMFHSQQPGKWNKRCINLRADGQMTVSKKEGDSDTTNICHLTDFDIYGPTYKQLKKIRSPKKICYAIKSQQKSAMFLDSAAMNFVHFVSTGDWELGDNFYNAVQSWRSWYLVNKLGEGQKIQAKPANTIEAMQRPGTASSGQSIPYQLGSFQPLLDFDLGELKLDLNIGGTPTTQGLHKRNVSSRDRRVPPSAFPTQRREEASAASAMTSRGRAPSINRGTGSMRSNVDQPTSLTHTTSPKRSISTRQKSQPLIDVTPKFQEAPQHVRLGRGVRAANGQPLIDLATDIPQEPGAIVVPPSKDWQRQETKSPAKAPNGEHEHKEQAFTGKGLLARTLSKRTQGASRSGHGVKPPEGKPVVDLSLNSKFADGSLLRQVEAWKGDDERGLVVDREKRVERSVKVGEGY